MLEGCQIISRDWRYIYVNHATARHGHKTKEELLGRKMWEVYPGIEKTEMFPFLKRCMEKRTPHRMENQFVFPDKSIGWFQLSIQPTPEGVLILSQDITERKKAEIQLRESQRKLAEIIDLLPDATFALDLQGRITFWNKAMEKMTGRKAKDMIGKGNHEYAIPFYGKRRPGIAELLLKPDKRIERMYSDFRRTEKHIAIEVHIPDMLGKDVFLWAIAKPLYNAEGSIVGVIEGIRDITEQKKDEKTLKDSEANFRALFETSGDPMFVHDFKGKIMNANSVACEKLGYTRKEMLALTLRDIDIPENAKLMPGRMRELIRKGRVVFEGAHITKDGRAFPVEVNARMGEYYGTPAVLSVARDISAWKEANEALRQSEEKLSLIFNGVEDAIVFLDKSGRIEASNRTLSRTMGYSDKDILGRRINELALFPPKSKATLLAAFLKMMVGIHPPPCEVKAISKNGRSFIFEVRASTISKDGEVVGSVAVVRNVTERKKAEEKLVQQKDQIEELSKTKERFMADMTHELKTPLSVIMLNLEMARKMDPANQKCELEQCLDLMWRNSMRLSRSVEQIMQLTRMDSVDISMARFSLLDMLHDVTDEYQPIAKTKGIVLEIEGPAIEVETNQHLLTLAVSNLLSNALKFTEKGVVSVKWKESASNVIITVSDTGIGVKPENRDKIFDKFFKENHDAPGSGIGLSITAEIIRKMGGRMEFDSMPGSGSTFRIIIPKGVKR
jgi:PAS domain S-box-containing protein